MKKAHVTHPELKCTFCLEIIGVKKNPNGQTYTALGVITKGTIIEVNVSELGLVTPGGKVVWGKYAQVRWLPSPAGAPDVPSLSRLSSSTPAQGAVRAAVVAVVGSQWREVSAVTCTLSLQWSNQETVEPV